MTCFAHKSHRFDDVHLYNRNWFTAMTRAAFALTQNLFRITDNVLSDRCVEPYLQCAFSKRPNVK